MVNEAEKNAAADKEKTAQIDLKNQSDTLCYQTKKQVEELDKKISSEDKIKIDSAVTSLEEAIKKEDFTSMEKLNEELKNLMMEIGQKAYSESSNSNESAPDPTVIETDFSTEK